MELFTSLAILLLIWVGSVLLVLGIIWLLDFAITWWQQHQQRQRDAAEAELDRTEQELHATILKLAEALAEEKVAAELTRQQMTCTACSSCQGSDV